MYTIKFHADASPLSGTGSNNITLEDHPHCFNVCFSRKNRSTDKYDTPEENITKKFKDTFNEEITNKNFKISFKHKMGGFSYITITKGTSGQEKFSQDEHSKLSTFVTSIFSGTREFEINTPFVADSSASLSSSSLS